MTTTIIGYCDTCGRPMRPNNAPSDGVTVRAATRNECHSCYKRRYRGLEGPATPRGHTPPPTTITLPPPTILDNALCAQTDPEIFFPTKGETSTAAKKVCAACPVQTECLTWALNNREPHGVWGGMTAYERRGLRTRRRAA